MIREEIEIDADQELAAFVGDAEEFLKAGLFPEGLYLWEFETMVPGETNFDGEKRPVIVGRLKAVAEAVYADGEFAGIEEFEVPRYKTHNFKLTGDAQQQLSSAYQVVTGRVPTGAPDEKTGRYTINKLALAEEIVGGQAWNTIYHFRPEGKQETYAVLGKKFRKQPFPKFGRRKAETEEKE